MSLNIYPQSPAKVPANLTSLTSSYQMRASLAILGIVLFFLLYFAMVAALGYLTFLAVTYPVPDLSRGSIFLKIAAVVGSGMLFAFTVKFIFKLKNHKPENRIKLKKEENPQLWEFIYKICDETGAPRPKNIYVDPDVNAYVSYTNHWLSLILPVKKELTIGMGLMDGLNLSEFKAVVSHEFGHFAQRSMRIGSYIHSANTIIHDMIYTQDGWDTGLQTMMRTDIRLAIIGWAIFAVTWVLKQILALFYQLLNVMHASLSREMEFNADKVAVKTSGSDAIVSSLWKLDAAFENWGATLNAASFAKDANILSDNLYDNYKLSMNRIADKQKAAMSELPDHSNGGKKYFAAPEGSKASMYASHPPNDARQENAKSPYISCASDERSPWLLIGHAEQLQAEMTKLVYKLYFGIEKTSNAASAELEEFIQRENAGSEVLEAYHNTFRDRFINIPADEEIEAASSRFDAPFEAETARLKSELKDLMEPVWELEKLMGRIQQLAEGTLTDKSIEIDGMHYKKDQANEAYGRAVTKREALFTKKFTDWDKRFCGIHLAMAKAVGKEDGYMALLHQQKNIVTFFKALSMSKGHIINEVNMVQEQEEVTEFHISSLRTTIGQITREVNEQLDLFTAENFVPLSNIETVDAFKSAIDQSKSFSLRKGIQLGGIEDLLYRIDVALGNTQRIDQKNLITLLTYSHNLESTDGSKKVETAGNSLSHS